MLRIFKYVFKYPLLIFSATLSMLIVIGIDQGVPLLHKLFVDKAISEGKSDLVFPILITLLLLTLCKSTLGFIKEYLYDFMSAKVHAELKNEVFNHVSAFEFGYFDHMNTGELMSRIGEDLENIWQTIGFGLRLFVENILYFVLSTIILLFLNPKLTLVCLVIMLPIGFIAIQLERKFGSCYGQISDQTALINTTAQENIAGVRLIKAFAREKHEILKFLKLNKGYYDLNMQQAQYMSTYFPIIDFLANTALVAMIILGGYFVLIGDMSLGTLAAFSSYIWNMIWPLRMLGWLTDMLSRTSASAKKIFAILDRPAEIYTSPEESKSGEMEGAITFNQVSFKYDEEMILNNINLTIPKGSTVAIMGTTGSGKSSLLSLLGRYYDAFEGEVLIDGVNVKNWDLKALRTQMSVVMQDTFLFSDTIENNIKFGARCALEDEVLEACKEACALDFIQEFEKGFQTEIGERGIGLSGGQKQRISIARALLRKAPLLILDDATSALDTETEYALLHNLHHRLHKTTTFIIAHRISAVKNADIILYLENGCILEKGTHQELLAQKGRYYNVYEAQFKSFI